MSADREKLAAFVNPDTVEILGLKLRPFSAASLVMLQLTENPLLASDGLERIKKDPRFRDLFVSDWEAIEEWRAQKDPVKKAIAYGNLSIEAKRAADSSQEVPDILFHIAGFIFIHAAPIEDVRRASKDKEAFREAVLDFTEPLSVQVLMQAASPIKEMIEKSMVGQDYRPEEDGPKPTGQPGPQVT